MPRRRWSALVAWLAATVTGLASTGGCSGESQEADQAETPPALGGAEPTETAPTHAMDDVEKPIAKRLGEQVAAQGLHVDMLDCPRWDGRVPAMLTCEGWFDGVPGTVRVRLTEDHHGMVAYDAELRSGVIATQSLVGELLDAGYEDVDCGRVPAYPTQVGSTITCAVAGEDARDHVVVTITDERGSVTISDF